MFRKVLLTLAAILLVSRVFGLYSDNYILGAYTYLRSYTSHADVCMDYLTEANYNCHVCTNSMQDNSLLAQQSNERQLDMILNDYYWDDDSETYGVYELTKASNYIYEAEYSEIGEIIAPEPCPSMYHYRITRPDGVGDFQFSQYDINVGNSSHDNYWKCEVNDNSYPSFAADTLYWKWLKFGENYSLSKQIITVRQDTLFFEFTMKIDNPLPDDPTEICCANVYVLNDAAEKVYLPIHSYEPDLYPDKDLTVGDFYREPQPPYTIFTFYTPKDEIPAEAVVQDHYEHKLLNLNFEVYWHNNEDLYIDYFRFYDDIYKKLDNGDYDDMIVSRFDDLNVPNLKYLYSKDEPCGPQYDPYRLVNNALDNNIDLMTTLFRYCFWSGGGYDYTDHTYNHHELFNTVSEPDNIMINHYHCAPNTKWNEVTSNFPFIGHNQNRIDRLLNWYNNVREIAEDAQIPFFTVPQTYGRYYLEPYSGDEHWRVLLPPSKMLKCLQFLPLCYDADGIINYKFVSSYHYYQSGNELDFSEPLGIEGEIDDSRNDFYSFGLINREGNVYNGTPYKTDHYYAIQEANLEIETIGTIIKDLEWQGAGTIETENTLTEFDVALADDLNSITIEDDNSYYSGYVECAVYKDSVNNNYFMLVNRRTNFSLPEYTNENGYIYQIPIDVDSAFEVADDQVVIFEFNQVPDNYVLIDQYSGGIYEIIECISEIQIGPGDGMLLKLCQLPIPEEITGLIIVSDCYIPYNVIILNGGILYVGDNVEFGPYAKLYVSSGGLLIMEGNIQFGNNSQIINHYGELYIAPYASLPTCLSAKHNKWKGIRCKEGSMTWVQNNAFIKNAVFGIEGYDCEVHIVNSTIENCDYGISMQSSIFTPGACHLEFISSTVIVPPDPDAVGISLFNSGYDHNFLITGTENEESEIIGTDKIGTGIFLFTQGEGQNSSFLCENTLFSDLETGISHNPYCGTDHEIMNCKFENCDTGIQLFGTGFLKKIEDCDFIDNGYGVNQNTVSANVIECNFTNNEIGIDYSNTHQQRLIGPAQPSIGDAHNSFFNGEDYFIMGIRCSDSSPRVSNCIFETYFGILSVNNAKVNASWGANNIFQDSNIHLFFFPDESNLSSEISLRNGHNDFYDQGWDFGFSSCYAGSLITINANGNWWEDFEVDSLSFAGSIPPIIIADEMDPEPNVPFISQPDNRFETASYEESQGNDETALDSFREILNDKLESEKQYWGICIDKVYNLSMILEEDINALLNYYEILYLSTPEYLTEEERTSLQFILKNYQKKCHIKMKEYQEAADIVVERINNPVSTLDSLFAVMQLETIYMLSYLDSTGRGNLVVTNYDKLAPKSLKEHNKKHKDHWKEIYILLGVGTSDELEQNLPAAPVLSGNYPNPFNPETKIVFSIPEDSKVNLSIYNIRGQKVRTLVNTKLEKGFHEIIWNSKDNNRKSVASGVYFYKFDVNGKTKGVKKMLLLK